MKGIRLQTPQLISTIRLVLFILAPIFLAGCYPSPHTTLRSPELNGKVLDEQTHAPVEGAKIFLTDHPNVSCVSRADGSYQLKATYNHHWGYYMDIVKERDAPEGEQWEPNITISHTNYITQQSDWMSRRDDVILLKKADEPPTTRVWLIFNGNGVILQDMGAGQYLKPNDIRITAHYNENSDPAPSRIHVGFVQRVYNPQLTPINNFDQVKFGVMERKDLDWEFGVVGVLGYPTAHHMQDLSRKYKLDFIP